MSNEFDKNLPQLGKNFLLTAFINSAIIGCKEVAMDAKKPWTGKRTYPVHIRLTEAEHEEITRICDERGGLPMARYFRVLHHKSMGRLGGDEVKAVGS